jgi:tRNA dimethylallyltransferase
MGFVDEVRTLYDREELHEGLPSIKSVGYRQIWRHLSDEITYKQMVEQSLAATRQLAKRQLTWLRRWENLKALGNTSTKSIDYILNYVQTTSI